MSYEKLLQEYDKDCIIEERNMTNDGLYCDGVAWINKNLTSAEKTCILAEELGHHFTTVGDILDITDGANAKQEHIARVWAYNKLLNLDMILDAIKQGYHEPYEIAEYLEVSEQFLKEYIEYLNL